MADLNEVLAAGGTTLTQLLEQAENDNCIHQPESDPQERDIPENEGDTNITSMLDQYMDRNGQPTGNIKKNKNNSNQNSKLLKWAVRCLRRSLSLLTISPGPFPRQVRLCNRAARVTPTRNCLDSAKIRL